MPTVRHASLADVPDIFELVSFWADRGDMLHRPINEIYESIRDFSIVRSETALIGCGALHIMGEDLAEIRALAVREDTQATGVGAALVAEFVREARTLGIERVFALTYRPGFFEKQGFRQADVMEFPQKVWNECVRCPFFTDCREIAVVMDL